MSVCLTPYQVNDPKIQGHKIPVPCGRCPPCFARRTSQWSFRLRVEGRQHMLSSFITLTYDPKFVPKTPNGFKTLDKTDVQKFFKRLRKINEKKYNISEKIIYYLAGEYGTITKRPHYHIILFNAHPDAVIRAWTLDNISIGHVDVGYVSAASIGYSLKYISKKLNNKKTHARDDRKKEFQLCSKGIGIHYLTEAVVKWHKAAPEERCYTVIEDGKKISLPRYFRNKIFDDNDKKLIQNKLQEIAIEKEFELFKKHGNNLENFTHNNVIEQINKHNYKQKQNYNASI